MTAAAKRHAELPGFERPVDDELESLCAAFLEARDDRRRARDDERDAREAATAKLVEIAGTLERDAHGNPTYVFRDGLRSYALKLSTSTKLTVEKLDDGGDDGEPIG